MVHQTPKSQIQTAQEVATMESGKRSSTTCMTSPDASSYQHSHCWSSQRISGSIICTTDVTVTTDTCYTASQEHGSKRPFTTPAATTDDMSQDQCQPKAVGVHETNKPSNLTPTYATPTTTIPRSLQ